MNQEISDMWKNKMMYELSLIIKMNFRRKSSNTSGEDSYYGI